MKTIFFKAGRFAYRVLNLSANQRINRVYSKSILDAEASNKMIYDLIKAGKPAMISRFGSPESKCLLNYLELEEHRKSDAIAKLKAAFTGSVNHWRDDVRIDIQDLVGFFPPTNEMLEKFAKFYINQIKKMNAVGIWGFVPGETFLIQNYCAGAIAYNPAALEPYYFTNPWSKALENKKVLVIHPFSSSIKSQYQKRQVLFSNQNILPSFELKTITAVQSIAGNKTAFTNWFEALNSMQQQINDIDFDVAIIGAGSYGLPLAAYIKERGKISIHIGGATQIMFGIKGKRWDEHPQIAQLYNENWVRPSADETVPQANKVEDACYW